MAGVQRVGPCTEAWPGVFASLAGMITALARQLPDKEAQVLEKARHLSECL